MRQKKNDEAEILLLKSLDVFEKLEVSSGSSRVNNDLGELYKKKGDKELSMKYLRRAVEIRRETEHWQGLATSLIELGDLMLETNNEQEAINFLNEAIEICTKINNRFKLSRANQLMYQLYRKKKEADKAIIYLEEYHRLKDEVSNAESANKIKAMEKKAATEKAEKEAEIERIRNVEMKLAFDIIEEKNKEILDSINYAKRIQYTLLASDEVLKKYLPEHFVLFQPKDIVSGDFYWFSHGENDETFYLAVCDSTGHGVPGAFMSLLNITYLNEAINEKKISEPGKILDYVREKLIKNVSHDGAKDGMDATLLKFKVQGSKLEISYAAAHNCPFLVRNGELIEMPFDKMPVGMDEYKHPFTTHPLPAKKGDMIYLGTDGYADQFGGEKFGVKKAGGKKFKKSNLKKLLTEVASDKLETQNSKLQTAFTDWKGDLEQVDDVCIIGIRI
jgi:serine phosphatase RsbU (regulator of sigma subunit)